MKKIQWHVGDVMMKYRAIRKWTRARLARKVGLTPYWMGKIERTGKCSEKTCERIAKALGTTIEQMRAEIPLSTDEVICRKHHETFLKADRVVHEGGAFAGLLVVALDAVLFAHEKGFSAADDLKRHLEAGTIQRINIQD